LRSTDLAEVSAMANRRLQVHAVSDDTRRELERLRRQAVGRVSQRAHMVLLSLRGFSVGEIARIFDEGEDVVRGWLHRFERRGDRPLAEVLDDAARSGRPPKDPLAGHIVDAQAQQSPPCFGLPQSCWTVGLLALHLASAFGLVLSVASVRDYLHRFDWRWGRPRLTIENKRRQVERRDPAEGEKRWRLERVRQWAQRMPDLLHLVFVDESDVCLLPVVRACWHKAGQQLRVPTAGLSNPKRTLFGALDITRGSWVWLVRQGRRSVHFEALLAELERTYPTGLVVVALDSAPAHTAKRIQAWVAAHPRVRLLWLPKYSAHETNPVEKIWWHLKGTIAANRYHGTIDTLVAAARRFFAERTAADLLRLAGQEPMPNLLRVA
jgi:transposase